MKFKQGLAKILVFALIFSWVSFLPTNVVVASGNTDFFLVRLKENLKADYFFPKYNVSQFEKIDSLNVFKIKTNTATAENLKNNPLVTLVEKDEKVKANYIPVDPYFSYQTYLDSNNSNIVKAWDITKGSSLVTVAIVDTGIDYLHEDLVGRMWTNQYGYYGYDFVNEDNDPMDDHYHGTVVAGIIAATKDNGLGVAGVANVKIMAVKSMTSTGDGVISDIAQGIKYAANNEAKIITLSLGLGIESSVLDEAVNYAYQKNSLVIAATGNSGDNEINYPARNPLAIGVGSINTLKIRSDFSNYGTGTSLVALGENIYSTSWINTNQTNHYRYNNGTSFAAPQVTGVAALLLSYDPTLTSDQIRKRLFSSAKKLTTMGADSYNYQYGYGELDAYAALTKDKNPPEINAILYKNANGSYQVTGSVMDSKGPSNILPSIAESNIKTVRYSIDNGPWQLISYGPVSVFSLNFNTPVITSGIHNISIEAQDTSGNIKTQAMSTANAGVISSAPASYKAQLVSQSSYVTLGPGQTKTMSLAFQNVGQSVWTKDLVHLGTSKPIDRTSSFADSSWLSRSRIAMKEDVVAPGNTAHFEFTITNPLTSGSYNEYFNLVAENITWFSDIGIFWKINVEELSYHAKYLNQSPANVIMSRGSTFSIWVDYQNTGTQTWDRSNVRLGTNNPLDRESPFYMIGQNSGWLSKSRISMEQKTVKPGETGRFTFTIKAPQKDGIYSEYFRPVADGFAWMEDEGLYWQVVVW